MRTKKEGMEQNNKNKYNKGKEVYNYESLF